MDQLILLPSILLHENNQLLRDDLAALSWPGCSTGSGRASAFSGSRLTFTGNGTFYVCVKNDGMSSEQQKAATDRPSSARSNRERQERILQLKERQNHERIKKLEELKEHAAAAAKLREEQDSRRKKHFEELGKKEEERRKQAEERRRMLDEERRIVLQTKWDTKKNTAMTTSMTSGSGKSNKPTFAFGSCTPRLIDNHVDGFLWKSQYNLNVTKEPGLRASSAHDLHLQQTEVRLSTSMYDWNQQRTTIDNPLVQQPARRLLNRIKSKLNDGAERIFCGRRKTDLTPTQPIRRDNYDPSLMSRSTSRGSGRVYSSMTRLDRSRSPAGGALSLTQHQHHPQQRPSRSKSTTHLSSTGLKLTRTEVLRQALAAKKDSGLRSGEPSRPPSSLSSMMTSSTHSQVQMRPRALTRKSRPASVHVTGVSAENGENARMSNTARRTDTPNKNNNHNNNNNNNSNSSSTASKKPEAKKRVESSKSPSVPFGETNTIKRAVKKKPEGGKVVAAGVSAAVVAPAVAAAVETVVVTAAAPPAASCDDVMESEKHKEVPEEATSLVSNVDSEDLNLNSVTSDRSEVRSDKSASLEHKVNNLESIESAFASSDLSNTVTPEPRLDESLHHQQQQQQQPDSELVVDNGNNLEIPHRENVNVVAEDVTVASSSSPAPHIKSPVPLEKGTVTPVATPTPTTPAPTPDVKNEQEEPVNSEEGTRKILTEEEAKAKIAEKRRLAREAVEREAARLEEEQRLEEERQRLEAEEAERILREAKAEEEERLRIAIEEQQKREEEEKKRKEEEELARLEKESLDREAAREAERIRLEMEERLRREEEERLERRKRVEAIMSRTRKKEAEQQAKNNAGEKTDNETINGHGDNNVLIEETLQSSNNSFNNNYNNNNEFSGNDSSTLISFEGMVDVVGGQEGSANPSTTTTNSIINNSLQDLLS